MRLCIIRWCERALKPAVKTPRLDGPCARLNGRTFSPVWTARLNGQSQGRGKYLKLVQPTGLGVWERESPSGIQMPQRSVHFDEISLGEVYAQHNKGTSSTTLSDSHD